jgi:predicted pyridoxine 5'-phosphate oxidase superfamily flavin-nucleotide-binding protein
MAAELCKEAADAWGEREGPVVLTTVDGRGMPNAIYASVVNRMADGRLAVADNYFSKTKANIDAGSKASILFITKSHKSYQVKGSIEYQAAGPLYQEMLSWANPKLPRKGVVVINPEETYRGKDKLA